MAKGKSWSKHRAERQKENWAKARKRREERIKAHPKRQNVPLGAHNAHSVDGYSIVKHGTERVRVAPTPHASPERLST